MTLLSEIIGIVFYWIVPVGVLLYIFSYAIDILHRSSPDVQKQAGYPGLIIAFLLALFFIAITVQQPIRFANPILPVLPSATYLGATIVSSYLLMFVLKRWAAHAVMIGVLVLLLSAAATIGLYTYLCVSSTRELIFPVVLGLPVGALFHTMFHGRSLVDSLPPYVEPSRKEKAPRSE